MSTNLVFASGSMLIEQAPGGMLAGRALLLLYVAAWIALLVGVWKVFEKGGQPGWACLIPIYNLYCFIKIAKKEWWWLLLLLVPLVNIVVAIALAISISKNFGKGAGFAAGLVLLPWIFYPVLGFGAAEYQNPSNQNDRRQRPIAAIR